MIHLTEDMSDLINHALANGTPCMLATASSSGQPNMSYRGSLMVFDHESLAYWDRGKRLSVEHIRSNPKVCVLFRHSERRISWRFFGEAASVKRVLDANRYGTVWYSQSGTASRRVKASPW